MTTILVVDDEPAVRTLVGRILERQGHTVILCQGAVDALAAPAPIDLLVVDLILPGMDGQRLTERLRERWPALPVLLMSGYSAEPSDTPSPPSAFLQKPMRPSAVVDAVELLLREAQKV